MSWCQSWTSSWGIWFFLFQFEVLQFNARASVGVFMTWKWIRHTTENQSLWGGGAGTPVWLLVWCWISCRRPGLSLKDPPRINGGLQGFFFFFLRGWHLHAECRQRPRGDVSCEGCLRQSVTHRCPLSFCFIWELKRLWGPKGSPFEAPLPVL